MNAPAEHSRSRHGAGRTAAARHGHRVVPRTFALVRHTARQEERVFRLGDMVFDAGRLVQVTREQAFIEVNGKKVELLTPMSLSSAAAPAQQPAGSPAQA